VKRASCKNRQCQSPKIKAHWGHMFKTKLHDRLIVAYVFSNTTVIANTKFVVYSYILKFTYTVQYLNWRYILEREAKPITGFFSSFSLGFVYTKVFGSVHFLVALEY